MLLTLLLMLQSMDPPVASPTTMRHSPATYVSTRSLIELQACFTRYWAQAGTVTPIPLDDGVTLDFYTRGPLGPGKARLSFTIREIDQKRVLGVDYRHPLSAKSAARALKPVVQQCTPESIAAEIAPAQ